MKLDCVITSVNNNDLYIDFIPLFIKTWNKLYPKVDVKIILIHNEIPEKIQDHKKNIILFKPIPNISSSFISQYIRMLYPGILNYKNGVMITDMDILPMNRQYYTENIKNIENNKFVYMRNVLLNVKEIAMCYNVTTPNIWSSIFNITSLQGIKERLISVYEQNQYDGMPGGRGWNLDQLHLYKNVQEWNKRTGNFVILNDNFTGYYRLDRGNFLFNQTTINNIKYGKYSDYHCLRPYSQYEGINETIYELL